MKNKHVAIRMRDDEFQALSEAARLEDTSVSAFVRSALKLHPQYATLRMGHNQQTADNWLSGQFEHLAAGDGRGGLSSGQRQALMALAEAGGSASIEDICRFSVDRRRFCPEARTVTTSEQKRLLAGVVVPLIVSGLIETPPGRDPLTALYTLTGRGRMAAGVLVGAESR